MRHAVFAVLIAIALALSPQAFAKAGKGSSFGSRGSRTADRPIERTITPTPAPTPTAPLSQPAYQPPPVAPMAAPAYQGGFAQRSPFLAGMAGGLLGVGIGSLLFGHSPALAAASEASPMASLFGLLLQAAMVGGLIWLGMRLFRGATQTSGPARRDAVEAPYRVVGGTAVAKPRIEKEFEPTDADKGAFADILAGIQKAWSEGDIAHLRQLATPEVVSWLAEDLSRDASQGVRNIVEDVRLLKGEIIESWRDGTVEFATAALTFSTRDYTVRTDSGAVVDGDPNGTVQSTEAWTFLRVPGGRWLLSAVER